MAACAAVAMALEDVRLANASRRPDLQIGPMWQRDETATELWGIQAQMDLPVVNTGAALVAQRMAELRQQQIIAAQLENRAVLEARAAVRRYERARRLVEQSRGEFPGVISDALKPFEDQFKAGQITLLEVFAARAALAQSRQSFLDLLNELAMAAADVTQATGIPPQQLLTDVEPPELSPELLPEAELPPVLVDEVPQP
jgi:outer membrane protein TolC